jgi:3-dehydroquinate dehydratase
LKKENKRCIILGMGEHGMITRIFGTLWGNEMVFAPQTKSEASAPGQLTKQQLATIFATLQEKENV